MAKKKEKFIYKCVKCGEVSPADNFCSCSPNSYYNYSYLVYDYKNIKKEEIKKLFAGGEMCSIDHCLPLLPNEKFHITLGEGETPIFQLKNLGTKLGFHNLFVKDETVNPTGSFKDRESSIVVNVAIDKGKKDLYITSSGNAAVSAAAFCNVAKLKCTAFVPKTASVGKKTLIKLYGANIREMNGEYEDIYRKVIDEQKPNLIKWNITSGYNIFREEGDKIISFEIFRQLGVPDKIIMPIGNGSLFFGVYKGFWELMKLGLTNKLPAFIGVQIKGFSPISKAIREKKDFARIEEEPISIAEGGIAAQESFCAPKVIDVIKVSKGKLIEIEEKELISSLKELIKEESFIVEPTSLAPFAALHHIKSVNETIVCVATGTGLKNLQELFDILK